MVRFEFEPVSGTMASHVKLKRDKVGAQDYDAQIKEVRSQLVEQLRVFDQQLEQKTQVLQDLSDYLRRRGEIEAEYARSLDKLAERFSSRIKRKEQSGQSVLQCWLVLLGQTRQESRDHGVISEICSTSLPQNLSLCLEHTQRLAKRTREACSTVQEELLKVTTEMQTTLKTYHQYHTEFLSAEGKLKEAEKLEEKPKGTARKVEKLIEKRQGKVQEIQFKCTKARNEYLLNLAAANSSMNKYYLQDISNLIDTSDVGYHSWVSRVLRGFMSGQTRVQQSLGGQLQQLSDVVATLDQVKDRDTLLQAHDSTFCLPLSFKYLPHEGDPVCEVSADCDMQDELETRWRQLESRLDSFTKDTEGISETLQEARSIMLTFIGDEDLGAVQDHAASQSQEPSLAKRRASLQETEGAYFTKVKEQLHFTSMISKLQAKHDLLQVALQKAKANGGNDASMRTRRSLRHQRSNRRSHSGAQVNQKLFTGNLLSFIQASKQDIPIVVKSCIRFINLNGLHHEGIFRVPGLQLEINSLRDAFENGDDPLADGVSDIDSVAGVLKLYFRTLEQPLFPEESFSQLMECGLIENESEKCAQIKAVISSYPKPVIVVMRYLFAFLNHVSQYSDENMMQPYNLAVCFGPSLIRGPEAGDASALQRINALVKSVVAQHESIFPGPAELPGLAYEKCMTLEQDDCEQNVDEAEGDLDSPSVREDLEAVALFDYTARSSTELSFRKGEQLLLHSKPSDEWWRGEASGTKGLIPHKYINITSSLEATKRTSDKRNSTGDLDEVDQSPRLKACRERAGSLGVSGAHGKASLSLPKAHIIRPAKSPDVIRKHLQAHGRKSTGGELGQPDNMVIKVDKEVCQQMNNVFHELLSRHPLIDPPISNSSSSGSMAPPSSPSQSPSQTPQKRTGFGRKGRDQQNR
ncbi:rho GTPase-activating protein 4a isoform X1 [Alosa sapidissima]|uniref:rho GTPase-activating protein 4a isoform X1 n=2 Tax=Alosa sapidissima TaxID=34773 RepID=UPI001C080B0E|nr:rho GTPase-activating protein 4a isoform X1 [Alosa sapidissima]